MNPVKTQILSVGAALPDTCVLNSEFEQFLDTSDEWIVQRTGIRSRYFVPKEAWNTDATTALGAQAVNLALKNAQVQPSEIDTVICATFSPDYTFPATACTIAHATNCTNAFAFDVVGACAGFLVGLSVANALIASGQSKKVVVVGAEVISRTLDMSDRSTCILFGDGAGAVVLTQAENSEHGILDVRCISDCAHKDVLKLQILQDKGHWAMNGQELFKLAVRKMQDLVKESLHQCKLRSQDIDLFIPHQANIRIIKAVAQGLEIPEHKVVVNIDRYGNTSAASIPLALNEVWRNGMIKRNVVVGFSAIGGGLTIGSAIVRF